MMTDVVHTLFNDGKMVQPVVPASCLWQLLTDHAHNQPTKPALIEIDSETNQTQLLTYQQLWELVGQCANYLWERWGVSAGSSLSFCYDNRLEVVLLNLSAGILGATTVPLDARRDVVSRMGYKTDLTHSRVLFTHPGDAHWQAKIQQLQQLAPNLSILTFDNQHTLLDEIAPYPTEPQFAPLDHLQAIQITLFTSGTTADPKGAQLTSQNLLLNAHAISQWLHIQPHDRFAAILPLHHINSTVFSLAILLQGATLVLFSEPPRQQFWQQMAEQQITLTSIVQKMLFQLMELEDEYEKVRSQLCLSRIQIGSDFVDAGTAEQFITRYAIPLQQGYGLTEVAFRATGMPIDLDWHDYLTLIRQNSIGTALSGAEVTILDPSGNALPPHQTGEICIRGPIVMHSYLQNPDATAQAFAGGWFHSGDLGWYEWFKGRRFFFYHSRQKEIIKKGAAMISPAAIDKAIRLAYPELSEAFAFGYPDPNWGEEIGLVVLFRSDVPDWRRVELLQQIVRQGKGEQIANLPKFEAPSWVIDWEKEHPQLDLPRTSTLKIQRARLREMAIEKQS